MSSAVRIDQMSHLKIRAVSYDIADLIFIFFISLLVLVALEILELKLAKWHARASSHVDDYSSSRSQHSVISILIYRPYVVAQIILLLRHFFCSSPFTLL